MFATLHAGIGVKQTHSYARSLNFEGWQNAGYKEIKFLYYLNPKSIDRNLEWDMKTNLCTDPGCLVRLDP